MALNFPIFSFLSFFFFPVRKYAGDECNVMACATDSEEDTNAKDLEK